MGPDIILTVLLASSIGAAIGTFTGLVPGIHVNTAAAVLLGSFSLFGSVFCFPSGLDCAVLMSCCIFSASAVHSFVDFVPSVFIGVPDADDALSVLPGHRLFLEGQAMRAVRAAAIGSVVGSAAALLLAIPLQWIMLSGGTGIVDRMTTGIIFLALSVIVITSAKPHLSVLLLIVTGFMGFAISDWGIPCSGILGESTLLFPLLTGLFGIPPLLEDASPHRHTEQTDDGGDPVGPGPGIKGVATGLIAGWFPGITATVGAALTSAFTEERDPARFISMTASIGTVTSVFSVVTLSVSGSGRSGTSMAVKEIIGDALSGFCSEAFLAILVSIAFASVLGYLITIQCGKLMTRISGSIPESVLNNAVLALISALALLLCGPFGLAVLVLSAAVGLIPPSAGIGRICLTGCLLIPVLLG